MDISTLREFACLAENLNFTISAKKCYVTQSTLSRHISAMEHELGVVLFIRNRKYVYLTPEGQDFLEGVKRMLDEYDSAVNRIQGSLEERPGTLRVSYLSGATNSFIRPAYEEFVARNSNVSLTLCTMESNALRESIDDGRADVSIMMLHDDLDISRFGVYKIFDDYYGIALPRDHELAGLDSLSRDDLSGSSLLIPNRVRFEEEWTHLHNRFGDAIPDAVIAGEINDIIDFSILPLTAAPFLVVIPSHLSFCLSSDRTVFVPIEDPLIKVDICAVWDLKTNNPHVSAFIAALRDVTKTMDPEELRNRVRRD